MTARDYPNFYKKYFYRTNMALNHYFYHKNQSFSIYWLFQALSRPIQHVREKEPHTKIAMDAQKIRLGAPLELI